MAIDADQLLDLAYDDVGYSGLVDRAISKSSEKRCLESFSDDALIAAVVSRSIANKLIDDIDHHVIQSKCKELFYEEILEDEVPF